MADCFQPNHHIFYADRVRRTASATRLLFAADSCGVQVTDAEDKLPKWETLPQGNYVSGGCGCAGRRRTDVGLWRADKIPSAPTDDSSVSTRYCVDSGLTH